MPLHRRFCHARRLRAYAPTAPTVKRHKSVTIQSDRGWPQPQHVDPPMVQVSFQTRPFRSRSSFSGDAENCGERSVGPRAAAEASRGPAE